MSFFFLAYPAAAKFATAPRWVAFEHCQPVLGCASVSSTMTFTFSPDAGTRSSLSYPMWYAQPSPIVQTIFLARTPHG
jgi:hypothetical protein